MEVPLAHLLAGMASATGGAANVPYVLTGAINEQMRERWLLALSKGHRKFVVNSRGGRESVALDIAESIVRYEGVEVIVNQACTSACAQYILAAADRVSIGSGAIVSFHYNSYGIMEIQKEHVRRLGNFKEIARNAHRASALYKKKGVSDSLLVSATTSVIPTCIVYSGANPRIFTMKDAWIPSKSYMDKVGLKLFGWWPRNSVDAERIATKYYRNPSRVIFGDVSDRSVVRRKIIPTCAVATSVRQ